LAQEPEHRPPQKTMDEKQWSLAKYRTSTLSIIQNMDASMFRG